MNDALHIPRAAALLADAARAKIVWALIDGTTRPAGELAFAANVSAPSASAHLSKLVEGGLLVSEAQGRHRYFRIASAEAAALIESLASFGSTIHPRVPPYPQLVREMPSHFLHARTCYDHLAGEIAVKVLASMVEARWLVAQGVQYSTTHQGREALGALGVDLEARRPARRAIARSCVDLTQRRPHLAGVLGAELLDLYVREKWILRNQRSRVVSVTPKGIELFQSRLAVSM